MAKKNVLKAGVVVLALGLLAVAGCSSNSSSSAKTPADIAPTELRTVATGTSTATAAKGTIFTCTPLTMTAASTPWASNGIIDVSKIPTVPGSVTMEPKFEITTTETQRILVGNGVPNHPIGTFPIAPGTEAYKYYSALPAGGYANAAEIPVGPYDLQLTIPKNPTVNATPTCFDGLITGVSHLTGASWHAELAPDSSFNFYDPNAALPTDLCFGHPYNTQYHYHGYSYKCMPDQGNAGEQSPMFGYAADGFGIFGPLDANGEWITNDQLDECHGRTSMIPWDGKMVEMYHYVINNEYPYSVGCLRGTPGIMSHDMMTH